MYVHTDKGKDLVDVVLRIYCLAAFKSRAHTLRARVLYLHQQSRAVQSVCVYMETHRIAIISLAYRAMRPTGYVGGEDIYI